jgi:hypothetical protein
MPSLCIVGHYETACGGCDTIDGFDYIYDIVNKMADLGRDVVFEGLLINSDVRRLIELGQKYPLHVVELNTSIETCLESVNQRRRERGVEEGVNPRNTIEKKRLCDKLRSRIEEANIPLHYVSRSEALDVVLEQLQIPPGSMRGETEHLLQEAGGHAPPVDDRPGPADVSLLQRVPGGRQDDGVVQGERSGADA